MSKTFDDDKASNTLTLIARVAVGRALGREVADSLWDKITKWANEMPSPELRQLGHDIINDNKDSKTAQTYRKWAVSIRRGSGNSERKRKEIMERLEYREVRKAVDKLLERRGIPILEAVRAKDEELGYQVGMLLDDIARILNVNSIGFDERVPIV